MNAFGWIYLILTILGILVKINEIGKPRQPVTPADAMASLLISSAVFWALFTWGLR